MLQKHMYGEVSSSPYENIEKMYGEVTTIKIYHLFFK